jgi:hypothetical protein
MHHKRHRATSRKEGKRIDNKRARAAEEQAIKGGHVRLVRNSSWWVLMDQPPIIDEGERRPKQKGKKKRAPKEHCPSNPKNKRHEYMRDEREVVDIRYVSYHPDTGWVTEPYTFTERYKLCVWCNKEMVRARYRRWRSRGRWG